METKSRIKAASPNSLGPVKIVSMKLPLGIIDKLHRLAIARQTNKTAVVREAIESITE